ncbi:MAG: hypothetical protein ACR2KJ_02490 [Jatrophihabitans sp.]
MADYVIKILLDDNDEPVLVELPGMELDAAEEITANLRWDVGEAKNVDAPAVEVRADLPGSDLVLDPRRVRSIVLEEAGLDESIADSADSDS